MTKHKNEITVGDLAEDTRALLSATAHVAGEEVAAARERVTSALEAAKETVLAARDKAVAGAKATDKAIRTHPYQAIGIAFGVGALVGFFLARRK
jgi:ElaB/YqjD/DUF883 family membrane-anchored ribosome-binding protein